MSYDQTNRAKINGSVTSKRSGIAVEALLKEGDNIRVTSGQDGTKYVRIGFDVEMRLDPEFAAQLKAAL